MAPTGKKSAPKNKPAAMAGSADATKSDNESYIGLRKYLDSRMIGLRSERMSWWTHWAQLAEYILPRRYRWLITANQAGRGSPVNQNIIDSTATIAARVLASGMMAGITSPSRRWFRLTIPNADLMENNDVKIWLDECTKRMLHVMADSNFYNAIHVMYMDLVIFGTAVMFIMEDFDDVIRCFNPCAGEYYLASSSRLVVNQFFREFTMTVSQLVEKFGIDKVSPTVKALWDNRSAGVDKEVVVGHAIEPDVESNGLPKMTALPYRETYWEIGGVQTDCLEVRGFHECPAIAPRWGTSGNVPYGDNCPAMDALGDVKQLQQETKRKAQAIDKMVNPPMIADVSLKNQPATLVPGGVTFLPSTQGAVGFKPVYEIEPPIGELKEDIKEVQERIKKVFFNDLFLMISQLDTVRTATEIDARKEEKLIQLGPVLERFQNEGLDPAIERIFNMMLRARLFPKAPKVIQGMSLQVSYSSMLADAQRAVETTGIERLLAFVGSIAASVPQAMDKINLDEATDEYGMALGVSPKILVPTDKANEVRQQRNQQQQQANALQESLAAAQGAKTLSQVDVGGGQNAVSAMLGNPGGGTQ